MSRRLDLQSLLLLTLVGLVLAVALVALVVPSRRGIAERAGHWDADVRAASDRLGVERALIVAVIAVESKGRPEARSHKGALGLMQILPGTAREMAEILGVGIESDEDLLDPATNILLGTAYLRQQLDRFDGSVRLALAAYNAGPRRVREWLRASPGLSAEETLRLRAFAVTRKYVENVLAYRGLIADED